MNVRVNDLQARLADLLRDLWGPEHLRHRALSRVAARPSRGTGQRLWTMTPGRSPDTAKRSRASPHCRREGNGADQNDAIDDVDPRGSDSAHDQSLPDPYDEDAANDRP